MKLELNNVKAGYGKLTILHDISVDFVPGEVTALIGQNGCGKSTLLKAIMGFLDLQGGTITLDGRDIRSFHRKNLAQLISYLPQESFCPDYLTLGQLIELSSYARHSLFSGPSAKDRQYFNEVLEIVGLADKAHLPVNSLSGGQKQRAWLALVLAQKTDMILLDEPVNHLDVKYQYAILKLVRELSCELKKTIIVVLHDINLATYFADYVVMVKAGNIHANGRTQDVITEENLQQVFGIPAELFQHNGHLICQPYPDEARSVRYMDE
ncbi:ABC transporter ATP-binding protein [Bartonella apis]|uniref:ABC transporter ATP-binding protein n=1 Tax=Bartonella apis TaxID=1686310 RepID=UPI0018DB5C0A|nr:ABC transporter ATP-binding protein [Bartonella apis]MBI0178082.1 ABC transporter ATP-binding protein [Bartonella apis]